MSRILEAIDQDGVLKPLSEPGLAENQKVLLEVRDSRTAAVDEYLSLCHGVYEGLSDEEVDEVEAIALDREESSKLSRSPRAFYVLDSDSI